MQRQLVTVIILKHVWPCKNFTACINFMPSSKILQSINCFGEVLKGSEQVKVAGNCNAADSNPVPIFGASLMG